MWNKEKRRNPLELELFFNSSVLSAGFVLSEGFAKLCLLGVP